MAVRKAKWQNDYIAKTYDRINLTLPKGQKEVLKAVAQQQGLSVNGFINALIDKALHDAGVISISPGQGEHQDAGS